MFTPSLTPRDEHSLEFRRIVLGNILGDFFTKSPKGRSLKQNYVPELAKLARLRKMLKNVSITERPSLGMAAPELRATPQAQFF
jgi:hypothetical protein